MDETMVKYWLDRNTMLATALAPKIGYAAAAEIAKQAVASGESIPVVARRLTELPDDELAAALDPAPMTEPGVRAGGQPVLRPSRREPSGPSPVHSLSGRGLYRALGQVSRLNRPGCSDSQRPRRCRPHRRP